MNVTYTAKNTKKGPHRSKTDCWRAIDGSRQRNVGGKSPICRSASSEPHVPVDYIIHSANQTSGCVQSLSTPHSLSYIERNKHSTRYSLKKLR